MSRLRKLITTEYATPKKLKETFDGAYETIQNLEKLPLKLDINFEDYESKLTKIEDISKYGFKVYDKFYSYGSQARRLDGADIKADYIVALQLEDGTITTNTGDITVTQRQFIESFGSLYTEISVYVFEFSVQPDDIIAVQKLQLDDNIVYLRGALDNPVIFDGQNLYENTYRGSGEVYVIYSARSSVLTHVLIA